MVSPGVTTLAPRPPSRFFRIAVFLVALLVVALAVTSAWFYRVARSALPQVDGKVFVSGLSAPVAVTRDGHGVPTIEAANFEDLFFSQGYVTAQDRLWQMDGTRRYASGNMAEVFGPNWVAHDKEQRTLLLRATAERAAATLPPDERSRLSAYARGVNAFIDTHRDH